MKPDSALFSPAGGLRLNATIGGLIFVLGPLAGRLREAVAAVAAVVAGQPAVRIVVLGEKAAQANQKWSPWMTGSSRVPASSPSVAMPATDQVDPVS